MDIIIEGNLTDNEGMNDLLETIIHLQSVPNALLRISSDREGIKGRVSFAPGGYILGGSIDNTSELGYPAIKKLLTLKSGNYAVLDVGHEHSSDVNQALWIKGEKVLEIWPNLPDSPNNLLDLDEFPLPITRLPQAITASGDLRNQSISRVRLQAIEVGKKNLYRNRNTAILLSSTLLTLLLLLMVIIFGNRIVESIPTSKKNNSSNKIIGPGTKVKIKQKGK